MIFYTLIVSNALPVTTKDFMTIIGATNRSWGIIEVDLHGDSGSSNYTEMGIYRCSAAATGTAPTAVTPVPTNPAMPAAALLAYKGAWGTTETTLAAEVHPMPANANGGRHYWRAPNVERALWMPGGNAFGSTLSIRPFGTSISGNMTLKLTIAEI